MTKAIGTALSIVCCILGVWASSFLPLVSANVVLQNASCNPNATACSGTYGPSNLCQLTQAPLGTPVTCQLSPAYYISSYCRSDTTSCSSTPNISPTCFGTVPVVPPTDPSYPYIGFSCKCLFPGC
jgi:hypothetical protein